MVLDSYALLSGLLASLSPFVEVRPTPGLSWIYPVAQHDSQDMISMHVTKVTN